MAWTNPKTWSAAAVLPASELNTYVRDNTNYLEGALGGPISWSRNGVIADLTGAVLYPGDPLASVVGVPVPFDFEVTGLSAILSAPRTGGTLTVSCRHYSTSMASPTTIGTLTIDGGATQYDSATPTGVVTGPRVLVPVITTTSDWLPADTDLVVSYWVTRA